MATRGRRRKAAADCRRCQRRLPPRNTTGYCRQCMRVVWCPLHMGVVADKRLTGWCEACKLAIRLVESVRLLLGENPPDAATLERNIGRYAARAAQGLPLFY